MKLKYYLNGVLAALLLATTSCSTDELVKKDGEQPEINADGTRTLKLRFDGLSIGTDKPDTKAGSSIATDEENLVDDLVLILISGNDPATAQTETWHYSKENFDVPDGVNKLLLTQEGKFLNGVVKTKLTGELGALVLTNGLSVSPTEEPVKLEDQFDSYIQAIINGTSIYYILSQKNADGLYRFVKTDLATQPIATPLPMYNGKIGIPANSTTVVMPLHRAVARFDLQNKIDNMRILRIIPRNAVEFVDPTAESKRIDRMAPITVYAGIDYDSEEAVASQKATSLFYTQSSELKNNQQPMTFDVETVLKDAAGNWASKTYNLQLTRDSRQIEIADNTRYTILLTEATDQTLTSSILIADWNEGGPIDGEMGNTGAVPEFAFPTQANEMPTIRVGTSNQHILAVDPKKANSSIKLSIPNYKTAIETGAANVDNVLTNLSFDIVPLDGNASNVWIKADGTRPFALDGDALVCTFVAKSTGAPDSYTGEYPSLMIRVKNKVNPAQYMAVKVVSWMITESGGLQDRYGNAGTESHPYEIHTTDDLLAMMGTPSYAFKDKFINLESDIDLSEYVFEKGVTAPKVGSAVSNSGLNTCTFNGNHHTIRNFTLKKNLDASEYYAGFFVETKNCIISNLSITGNITTNVLEDSQGYFIGGIFSDSYNGIYINCHNHINITLNDTKPTQRSGGTYLGGVGGNLASSILIGCSNTGIIRSDSEFTGGIAGVLSTQGSNKNPLIVGCSNNGEIIPGSSSFSGGLVDVVLNNNKIYISNCFNSSVINGGKGGAFGTIANSGPSLDHLRPDDTPAVNIINCFYNTTGSSYENAWGTAIESDAMKTGNFVNQLNDFSEFTNILDFNKYYPLLNNCFRYKTDSYPVLK